VRHALKSLGIALVPLIAAIGVAQARETITLGYAASDSYVTAMVAKDKGLFEKRGLDVDLKIIALNSAMPAALDAGTVQIAGTTSPVFLQAIDRGIDLVAIAGGNVAEKTNTRFAAVARSGVTITWPQDFIGKTVGVPSLGASTHVLFRNWLLAKGVRYDKVKFVEIPFPQMQAALRNGTVDVVVTNDPVLYQILNDDEAAVATTFMEVLRVQIPIVMYSTTREWAGKHRSLVVAFRESIIEAIAMIVAEPQVARDAETRYLNLPAEIIANVPIPRYQAAITDAMLRNWVDIMNRQQMLGHKIDVSKLVVR
jgi:NitT/TauT family transport system substrate-binding protein